MSFFQKVSRSVSHTKSTRAEKLKCIYASIFIGCSILMPVIVDLGMLFNVIRESMREGISVIQEIKIVIDIIEKTYDINIAAFVVIVLIASIISQIAPVVLSIIGAKKSEICIYIVMVGYALGTLFYIFFPIAGMNFSNLSTTFPIGFLTVTIPGEIAKYFILDLLLKIIALFALYKFKRVKYDAYGM